jgi:hypothetical protein
MRRITHVEPVDPPSIFRDHDLEPRYQVPEPDERVKVDD